MEYFANIDDNGIVTSVIVVADSDAPNETTGIAFCKALLGSDTNWVQTSKAGSIRHRYAGIGMKYDPTNDVFYDQRPYTSWTLDTSAWIWDSPVTMPDDEGYDDIDDPTVLVSYNWDEDNLAWVKTTTSLWE